MEMASKPNIGVGFAGPTRPVLDCENGYQKEG